jgi:hypothetical protein
VKEESQQEKKNRPTLRRLPECDDEEAKEKKKIPEGATNG